MTFRRKGSSWLVSKTDVPERRIDGISEHALIQLIADEGRYDLRLNGTAAIAHRLPEHKRFQRLRFQLTSRGLVKLSSVSLQPYNERSITAQGDGSK
jgi:hypothetical protein